MRIVRWVREFGLRPAFRMERELWGERIASVLLRTACRLDHEMWCDQERAKAAREVAHDLVYDKISRAEAVKKFYGIYY